MALITLTSPGDVVGAITAIANATAEVAKTINTLASSTTSENQKQLAILNDLFEGFAAIVHKLNQKLHLTVDDTTPAPTPGS